MPFLAGTVVTRREVLHGRPWLECPVTVVADDGDVLAVLLVPGSPFTFHEHPFGPHPWSAQRAWGESVVLQLHRPADAYAVWMFFEPDGTFQRWYVNVEAPLVRGPAGFDTDDHGLDLVVHPDGRREWKDVEDLAAMVVSGRMTGGQVLGVLDAAAGVVALLDGPEDPWWLIWRTFVPPSG